MVPSSLIRGVTSNGNSREERLGVEQVGALVVPPVIVVLPVSPELPLEILVTNSESVPTLRSAFWLFIVATRGLDRCATTPCESRKVRRAAKFLPWTAMPKIPAAALLPPSSDSAPRRRQRSAGQIVSRVHGVAVPPISAVAAGDAGIQIGSCARAPRRVPGVSMPTPPVVAACEKNPAH
jgi:hypothetical protein